jgi:hypothetical protein
VEMQGKGSLPKPQKEDSAMRKCLMLVITVAFIGVNIGSVGAQPAFPDPAKWNESSLIRIFEQNAGAFLSGIYRLGGADNGASTFTSNNDMFLPNPNSIQTMEATVTLLDASAGGAVTSFPRAGLQGFFYWNGTGSGATGNVESSIHLAFNATTQQPEARYNIVRCDAAPCSPGSPGQTTIASAASMPVSLFEPHRLKVSYDGTNFSYQVDGGTPIVVAAPDVTRLAPKSQSKELRTRIAVPASPTESASVLALFDNVAVNGAPYETFDAKTLPRAQIVPGSGTFSSNQTFDVVVMVETAGEVVTNVRITVNGADFSSVLPQAAIGNLPSGGVTYRFANVPASFFGIGTPAVLGVEATTASGKTARGFALWNTVAANE